MDTKKPSKRKFMAKSSGRRAVIAASFGDIHYGNAIQNGLLPAIVPQAVCAELRAQLHAAYGIPPDAWGLAPAGTDPVVFDREHVVVLSDYSFMHPHTIFTRLKQEGGFSSPDNGALDAAAGALLDQLRDLVGIQGLRRVGDAYVRPAQLDLRQPPAPTRSTTSSTPRWPACVR